MSPCTHDMDFRPADLMGVSLEDLARLTAAAVAAEDDTDDGSQEPPMPRWVSWSTASEYDARVDCIDAGPPAPWVTGRRAAS
jgi:hypothetical protein